MGINLTTSFYSPLRYPGGKGKLAYYVQLLIEHNLLVGGHYVEPYAGGASVALSLLFNEFVDEIHINDYDFRVYSFWDSILNSTDEFCEKLVNDEITPANWEHQKEVQRNPKKFSKIDIGYSTFFLNRTNRSGILKAGMIGGKEQGGDWKLDARFNKEELLTRIRKISRYKDRINLYNEDAAKLTKKLGKALPKKTFFYFDPPYYKKGKDLYINFYEHNDHVLIASIIRQMTNKNWIVSYDNNPNIKEIYRDFAQRTYELNYHANAAAKGSEIIIYSNDLIVPILDNPTDKKELKNFATSGLSENWILASQLTSI
ncbi:DNA adenine methylase [Arachidicoccus terrestris]|uniref:DNA adenine methylase n=1 Tax=Arachidicoccus terrestris TaxID=2875539 RepID=UPI001CC73513|nr:DNA adenine methylase [Arachidicoccus terrestris]UAY55937.1 DNA adenine methylase [Arachidicoccus terrestris]